MDALKQTLVTKGIKLVSSRSFFYQTYPFRCVVDLKKVKIAHTPYVKGSKTDPKVKQSTMDDIGMALCEGAQIRKALKIVRMRVQGDLKTRRDGFRLSFYLHHQDELEALVGLLGKWCVEVHMPETLEQMAVMALPRQNKCIDRVRDTLYYGRFRYQVMFRNGSPEDDNEIDEWMQSYYGSDKSIFDDEVSVYYIPTSNRTAYVASEDDVLLIKLAMGSRVRNIEKAILKSEIQ